MAKKAKVKGMRTRSAYDGSKFQGADMMPPSSFNSASTIQSDGSDFIGASLPSENLKQQIDTMEQQQQVNKLRMGAKAQLKKKKAMPDQAMSTVKPRNIAEMAAEIEAGRGAQYIKKTAKVKKK